MELEKIYKLFDKLKIIDLNCNPTYYKEVNMDKESFINRSYNIGDDTIVIGIYDNKEYKCASFFHELGHILTDVIIENKYYREIEAWRIGLNKAEKLKVKFSKDCYKWINAQIETYSKYKHKR